jgi:GNAT superfamily N-acetyltransferase
MIGVQHHEREVGQVRRLRVAQDYRRRGIGKALMETAITFCKDNEYIKVAFDTFAERTIVVEMFQKLNFSHGGTRHHSGKDLMYFYLDLYTGPPRREKGDRKENSGYASL